MCDKSAKFHLTAMKSTVAQNAAEKDNQASKNEKPHYQTTKDVHYPVGSFNNASIRQEKDVPDFINCHKTMKTQNYKVTVQGPPQHVKTSIKQ